MKEPTNGTWCLRPGCERTDKHSHAAPDAPTTEIDLGLPKLKRYAHEFQRASGSREMIEAEEGEWVKHEDAVGTLFFIHGYLHGHCEMLEQLKVHPKVIESVRKLVREIEQL